LLGAQSGLAVCLLPAALFWVPEQRSARALAVRLAVAASGAFALYANVVLQNRTPMIAAVAALAAAIAVFLASERLGALGKASRLAPIALAAAASAAVLWDRLSSFGVYQRFESHGLESARYELWGTVLTHLFDDLAGGRVTPLGETAAHNLWLDIAWDAGPLPFALMVVFHASLAGAVVAAVRRGDLLVRLVVAGAGVAFLSTAMVEPAMSISSYTTLLFYYCGLVLGLAAAQAQRAADEPQLPIQYGPAA
jgi:hypothetical protein